jgi:DNA repair exonuclease SbcCD ATPase subunit
MGKLLIESINYKGENYFYINDKLGKGINLLVGDNENGKSTFTYLIVYGLGLTVEYFNGNSSEPINPIVKDTNNFVELRISIDSSKYYLKRIIGENVITVYDKQKETHVSFSLIRNGYVYKKEGKTFSDWILEKLGIDIIEVNQNSNTHKVNFDDLLRFVYYDQVTDNRKIINEFGIKSTDFYKNSNIMKRSIFEVLMSGYNEEYYSVYYQLKELNKKLQEEKENKKSLEIIKDNILRQTNVSSVENLKDDLQEVKNEIDRLDNIREEVKQEGSFGEEVVERLVELQKQVVALTHKINNIEFEKNVIEEGLIKAQRVGEDTQNDIEHIDKILFTSHYIDIISEDKCPFCLETIGLEEGHCICGSEKSLDFSRFIYSDKEYLEIMKSKIKTLETIKDTILDYQNEYNDLDESLTSSKEELVLTFDKIKSITKDLKHNTNAKTIDELTNKIIELKERETEIKLLVNRFGDISSSRTKINKLENDISKFKRRLDHLEEQKENDLQMNIEKFEEIYSAYLNDFYENEKEKIEIKLDRNYNPVLGEYKHQSFNVPKRLFYYLTLLKMSLGQETKISYPSLLIIDTLKDEGIEVNKLKKLFKYLEEFKEDECQIIITSGYDEYTENQENYLIDWLSDSNKLLKENNGI